MTNKELLKEINGRESRIQRVLGDIALAAAGLLTITVLSVAGVKEVHAAGWESQGTWLLTAYCPESCCNGGNAWKTASGAKMVFGRTVAVGHLPFGTRLLIDGHEYVVEDRGVRGHQVDILYPDHESALDFGMQHSEVFIWRD